MSKEVARCVASLKYKDVLLIIFSKLRTLSKSRKLRLVCGSLQWKWRVTYWDENKAELMSGNISGCKVAAARARCVRKYLPALLS